MFEEKQFSHLEYYRPFGLRNFICSLQEKIVQKFEVICDLKLFSSAATVVILSLLTTEEMETQGFASPS